MKLLYAPGACSLGIHLLLEEIGAPYETEAVNLREGAQFAPAFTALNPKSKVPTLVRDDGSVLTEFPAIAFWLARTHPAAKLLPEDAEGQARALEAMDHVVSSIHMRGFTLMFRPDSLAPTAEPEAAKARGREIFTRGLEVANQALAGKDYVLGDFSIADAALFYVEFWGAGRMKMALPAHCQAHYARMLARPAVQRTMAAEGLEA
jgi:glutathione S-transferase